MGAATVAASAGIFVRGFTMAASCSIQAAVRSAPSSSRPARVSSGTRILRANSASVIALMYSAFIQSSFLGSKVAGFLEMRSSEKRLASTSRGMTVVSPSSDQPRSAR